MEKGIKKGAKVIVQLPLKKVPRTCHTTSSTWSLAAREAGPHSLTCAWLKILLIRGRWRRNVGNYLSLCHPG